VFAFIKVDEVATSPVANAIIWVVHLTSFSPQSMGYGRRAGQPEIEAGLFLMEIDG
jgi:hypothetical protein